MSSEQRRWLARPPAEAELEPMAASVAAPALADPARLAALQATGLLERGGSEAFARLARLTARALDAPSAFVSLVDADRRIVLGAAGLPESLAQQPETPLSHSFCQHVVERGAPLVVEDARNVARLRESPAIADRNVVAYAGMPLINADGQTLGAVSAVDGSPRVWTTEELDLLADLAATAMAEVERCELSRRLDVEVRRDPITGLGNRLAWEAQAPRELARARRFAQPLVVMSVELERSRRARSKGDALLRDVAEAWTDALRDVDLLVRLGGDEFVVLLPTTALDPAFDVVNRLRHSLPSGVGCSAGLAMLRDDEAPGDLLARAGGALARALRSGRNASALAA